MNTVLFDLDNTLWYSPTPPDFDRITRLQAARIAPVLARAGTEAFVRSFWTEWQRRDAALGPGDYREIDWAEVMAATFAAHSLEVSPAEARRVWEAVNTVPRSAFNTEPCPGAIEALHALKSSGWRTAIVTNYPLEAGLLRPHLDACGLGAYIDFVVTSVDTGVRKPQPEPFLAALEALHTSASAAAMVGDSLTSDIAPAVQLGIQAIHFSAAPSSDFAEPPVRVRTLAELPGLLGAPTTR